MEWLAFGVEIMTEAITQELIKLTRKVRQLEGDIDRMLGRFEMVGRLWESVKEIQDHLQANEVFLAHTLLYREVK